MKKTINLSEDQLLLLLEILASARIEANFKSQKRHIMFLPDLFKKISDYEKDIASIEEVIKIVLK